MILPMLVIDKDIEVSTREQAVSDRRGVSAVRVDSMQEAIEKHLSEPYLFTVINADNIQYKPLFKVLRGVTAAPILMITSNFKVGDQTESLLLGADGYTMFHSPDENFDSAMAFLKNYNERVNKTGLPPGTTFYKNFLVMTPTRRIFCNDERLQLTKMEYRILHYLIMNHDIILTYKQIYRKVWDRAYDESAHQALWDYILRIRKKIRAVAGNTEYIINERDVGYRFTASHDI